MRNDGFVNTRLENWCQNFMNGEDLSHSRTKKFVRSNRKKDVTPELPHGVCLCH